MNKYYAKFNEYESRAVVKCTSWESRVNAKPLRMTLNGRARSTKKYSEKNHWQLVANNVDLVGCFCAKLLAYFVLTILVGVVKNKVLFFFYVFHMYDWEVNSICCLANGTELRGNKKKFTQANFHRVCLAKTMVQESWIEEYQIL